MERLKKHGSRRDQFYRESGDTTSTDFWMNLTVVVLAAMIASEVGRIPLEIGGTADPNGQAELPPIILNLELGPDGAPILQLFPKGPVATEVETLRTLLGESMPNAPGGVALTTSAETSAATIQWALTTLEAAGAGDISLGVRTGGDREN